MLGALELQLTCIVSDSNCFYIPIDVYGERSSSDAKAFNGPVIVIQVLPSSVIKK